MERVTVPHDRKRMAATLVVAVFGLALAVVFLVTIFRAFHS